MQINIQNGSTFYASRSGCFTRLLVMMASILIAAWLLPGVEVGSAWSVLLTALVISVLNNLLRPVLLVLARPASLVALVLVLFGINTLVILMASGLVSDFHVKNIGWAALFSLVLTAVSSLLELPNRHLSRKASHSDNDHPQPPTSDTDDEGFTPYEEIKD